MCIFETETETRKMVETETESLADLWKGEGVEELSYSNKVVDLSLANYKITDFEEKNLQHDLSSINFFKS